MHRYMITATDGKRREIEHTSMSQALVVYERNYGGEPATAVLIDEPQNLQMGPWPHDLVELVEQLRHRPNWRAQLYEDFDRGQGCRGLTLVVTITEPDAYHPERPRTVAHYFPVPAAAYDYRSWRRWLLERLGDIDTHERMEQFTINGEKPYAPSHGPGNDPYMVREVGTELDRRTSFKGEVNPK